MNREVGKITQRYESAKELVDTNSVKKYIIDNSERWIVVGNTKEYLVFDFPNWCGCESFSRSIQKEKKKCKHIIAIEIAKQENKFEIFNLDKNEYDFVRPNFINF